MEELAWITTNSKVNTSLVPRHSPILTIAKEFCICVYCVQVCYGYTHHCSSLLLLARYLSLLICCLPSLPTNRRSSPFINKPTGILWMWKDRRKHSIVPIITVKRLPRFWIMLKDILYFTANSLRKHLIGRTFNIVMITHASITL